MYLACLLCIFNKKRDDETYRKKKEEEDIKRNKIAIKRVKILPFAHKHM